MKELPLVFFTVLAQASAGAFILMWVLSLFKQDKFSDAIINKLAITCIVLVGIAGVSAIFHLGQPLRAINALFGIGRSPMSNEIITCAVYGGFAFAFVASRFIDAIPDALTKVLGLLASLAAAYLIYSIPQVYQLESVQPWNTNFTGWQMVMTAVMCGGALVAAMSSSKLAGAISSVAIVLLVATLPSYFAFLGQASAPFESADLMFWVAKAGLLLLGMIMLIIYLSRSASMTNNRLPLLATAVIVVAEIAGRIGFYDLWAIGM